MAYKFPLATLLRVRVLREEKEERMLQQIGAEIARTVQLQTEVGGSLERLNANQDAQSGISLKGTDVQSRYAELLALWQSREDLRQHLEKLEELKRKQAEVYAESRQNREMLTDLCDTRRSEHDAQMAKQEQKRIDDIFAARRKTT